MLETPGLVAEKEPMQEVAPLGGKPGCTPWESLRGCQWDLQEMFGPGTADLRSLQWAKGSAFSHKGLGNPAWKGMGWASLHHPTKAAACLRLGVAACCGAGGFTGAPRVPCIPCSSSSSFISVLEAFCLLGSNFASGVPGGRLYHACCRAGRAFGVISRQAVSLAALLRADWRDFHAS